jgi:hypothetical protein
MVLAPDQGAATVNRHGSSCERSLLGGVPLGSAPSRVAAYPTPHAPHTGAYRLATIIAGPTSAVQTTVPQPNCAQCAAQDGRVPR